MTLSAVEPVPALVLIDLQKGITATTKYSMPDVVARAAALASAFRRRGLPVVLVNVAGGSARGRTDAQRADKARRVRPDGWTDLAAELHAQPTDFRVTKTTWSAFYGTELHTYLQERGVTQLFLGGVATSIGVESTARAAFERGYHVVLVTDAMTDGDAQAHENSITRIFPRLGETTTTEMVLTVLASPGDGPEQSPTERASGHYPTGVSTNKELEER
jgi:nicotinamidase-related amidase